KELADDIALRLFDGLFFQPRYQQSIDLQNIMAFWRWRGRARFPISIGLTGNAAPFRRTTQFLTIHKSAVWRDQDVLGIRQRRAIREANRPFNGHIARLGRLKQPDVFITGGLLVVGDEAAAFLPITRPQTPG